MRCDRTLIICIMAFWSWSSLQFTLVLTAAKARKPRAVTYDVEDLSTSRTPESVEPEEIKQKKGND